MNQDLTDKLLIRELVERWAVWRDAGDRRGQCWLEGGALER